MPIIRKFVSIVVCLGLIMGMLAASPDKVEASGEISLYIAPDGNDNNDGSMDAPFATIGRARDEVRKIIAEGMNGNITVYLRGGDYYVESSIDFDERDSGRNGFTVTYRNYPGEEPVIVGGKKITGWEPDSGNIYKAYVGYEFYTMYANGKRATEARIPNQGYFFPAVSSNNTNIHYAEGQIPEPLDDLTNVRAFCMPGQAFTVTTVSSVVDIDYVENIIKVDHSPYGGMTAGQNGYYLTGSRSFLDMPGEYYYDRTSGYLYYWPEDSTTPIGEQEIIAPATKRILNLVGSDSTKLVENIIFDGLTIKCTDMGRLYLSSKTAGNGGLERDDCRDGTVFMENAVNITVRNCKILLSGLSAVVLNKYSQNNTIYGNLVEDFGYHGIYLVALGPNKAGYINKNNLISNNLVRRGGQLILHGAGIEILMSGGNEVSYNRVSDMRRSGIALLGDRYVVDYIPEAIKYVNHWDYIYSRDNVIKYNEVTNVVTEANDSGAINLWGNGKNNIIENNWVHDTRGMAFYNDDMSDYTIFRNNVASNVTAFPFILKGMKVDCINNIVVTDNNTPYILSHAMGHIIREQVVNRNVFYSTKNPKIIQFNDFSEDRFSSFESNLYKNASDIYQFTGHPEVQDLNQWREWRDKSYDQYSITADPLFVNQEEDDYRFMYNSPAYTLGIEDIDMQKAGLKPDFKFTDKYEDLDRIYIESDIAGIRANINLDASENSTAQLTVTGRTKTGFFTDLEGYDIAYRSDDASVAKVSSTGFITAKGRGIAKITVDVSKNGALIKFKDVYVIVDDSIRDIQFKTKKEVLLTGETNIPLHVSAVSELWQNLELNPSNTLFESSNPFVLTVDAGGNMTAVSQGEVIVSVLVKDNKGNEKSAQLPIKVREMVASSLQVTAEKQGLYPGETNRLKAEVTMSDGTVVTVEPDQLEMTSSNPEVAVVDENGEITAISYGKAYINVKAVIDGKEVSASYTQFVYPSDVQRLPSPWEIRHYGDADGYVSFDSGTFTFFTDAADAWGTVDETLYVYQKVNLEDNPRKIAITAKLDITDTTTPGTQFGIDVRVNDSPDSRHIYLRQSASQKEVFFTERKVDGGETTYTRSLDDKPEFPSYIRMVINGTEVIGYYMINGEWKRFPNSKTLDMDDEIMIGLAVMAGKNNGMTEAVFSDVSIEYEDLPITAVTMTTDRTFLPNIGDSTTLVLKGMAGGILCNLPQHAEIAFTSSDENVISVDPNGVVTAKSAGASIITATVVINGVEFNNSVIINAVSRLEFSGMDIGNTGVPGSYGEQDGFYTVIGSGSDIWYANDAFHYAYRPMTGNGVFIAHVVSQQNTNSWAKAGVMIREALTSDARYAAMLVTPSNGATFQRRTAQGTNATSVGLSGITAPYWLKLERWGDTMTGYVSPDCVNWTPVGTANINGFSNEAYVGLAVTSHDNTKASKAVFNSLYLLEAPFLSIELSAGKDRIGEGADIPLKVSGMPGNVDIESIEGITIFYSSSDPAIAAVDDNGVVHGVKAGTATITVSVHLNGRVYTDAMEIHVEPLSLESLDVSRSIGSMGIYDQPVLYEVLGTLNNNQTYSIEQLKSLYNAEVKFTSSNPDVAVIDSNGRIAPVGFGVTVIKVEVSMGGVTKTKENTFVVHNGYVVRETFENPEETLTRWDLQGDSNTINTENPRSGIYSLKVNKDYTVLSMEFGLDEPYVGIIEGWFYDDGVTTNGNVFSTDRKNSADPSNTGTSVLMVGIIDNPAHYMVRNIYSYFTTAVERTKGWHKVILDNYSVPGKINAYIDGTLVGQYPGYGLKNFMIGDLWSDGRYSQNIYFDDITLYQVVDADNTPPVTTAFIDKTPINGWFNSDVTVTLNASDGISEVKLTEYSMDVGMTWNEYTAPVIISSEGVNSMLYRSIDMAGNTEECKEIVISIDKTAPTYCLSVNQAIYGDSMSFEDYRVISFNLSALDSASGVNKAELTIDGVPYVNDSEIDLAGMTGTHYINVLVTDNAGNSMEEAKTFTVTTSTESMTRIIDRYLDNGMLDGPFANAMKQKLVQAQDHYAKGHIKQAIKHMEQFISFIDKSSHKGWIPEEGEAVLRYDAGVIINQWLAKSIE